MVVLCRHNDVAVGLWNGLDKIMKKPWEVMKKTRQRTSQMHTALIVACISSIFGFVPGFIKK